MRKKDILFGYLDIDHHPKRSVVQQFSQKQKFSGNHTILDARVLANVSYDTSINVHGM
jgi:hypothetical protein